MKASRLPMWLILLGILLLTLFFGRMLQQALHNDQLGFERDLRFQSQEQGITIRASRAGLERRVQLLASTLSADPVVRELLARAADSGEPGQLDQLRQQLRSRLSPYWQSLQDGSAEALNVYRQHQGELTTFLRMQAPQHFDDTPEAGRWLAQSALQTQRAQAGVASDGHRAATAGVAPVLVPSSGDTQPQASGLLEIEFGVITDVEKLGEQLGGGVAVLFHDTQDVDIQDRDVSVEDARRGQDQGHGVSGSGLSDTALPAGAPGGEGAWWVGDARQPLIKRWLTAGHLPVMKPGEPAHRVVHDEDGTGYLLSLIPLQASGSQDGTPVTAVAIWKDITAQLDHRDALVVDTWLRWGVAWLIAESCLLFLLWGTRRVTRHAMMESHRRLKNQKEALQTLNDIAALQNTSFLELIDHALDAGCRFLGMPFGIVSHIENGIYHVESAHSPGGILKSGQTFDVRETFCEFTLQADDVVAFADADEAGHGEHPCRVVHAFKGYIGAPLWVNGQRYGTLGFSSDTVRESSFDEAEQEFVRLLARWVGSTLSRWKEIEAREELSHRLTKIASQTPGLIYQYRQDPEGRPSFPYASDAIKELYGLTPEEAAADASQVFALVHEDDLERLILTVKESERDLTPWNCEYRVRRDNGDFIWLSGQSIPERESDGGTIWHGFLHDVTARKRDESLKSEFISTVSHELRTPLTSISGALGLIQGGALGTPPEAMRGMLVTAHNNAQRLILLINDLLDIEKLVAGKMAFQMQEQRLMPLIDQAIESNQAYAAQFRARLVINERLDDAGVNVDAMRLQQVMSNLLSNAAKFSPPDMQVEVRVESIADRVRISVIDSGPGIPEEFHERIFQKFSQADASSTRKQGGTGLGLAITRELVERMRGSINFFSEPGHGACFFVELPCFDLPQEAMDQVSTHEVDEAAEASFSGSRLLIVEDDPDTAALLATLVRHWGYRAEVAHTMNDAMKWLERRSFDAITLDLMLPDGNGLTLLRQLREQPQTRDIPVLVVSATAEEGQLEIGGRLEAVNWLVKPFDEQRLSSVLRSSLSLRPPRERILHIESDPELSHRVAGQVASSMTLDVARSLQEARYLLDSNEYGLISLDLTASRGPGWEVIPLLSQLVQQPAVVILSEEALAPTLLGRVKTAIAKPGLSAEALREAFERQLHGAGAPPDEDQENEH